MGTSPPIDLRDLIARKRDGEKLQDTEIELFVRAAAERSAPEVHLAAMLMAIFCRGLDEHERTAYALAMMRSGEVLDWTHLGLPTIDKHSTGGVGDKVSLIWAPMMAALGYGVPMISGRGLGHTGGTLDKLETIPGYRTDLDRAGMERVLRACGCTIVGQTASLVPADRTLYDLRSRTATVPTLDHIAPSIMSKKLAEGAETLVLDVKVGRAAFMQRIEDARALARVMVAIGRGAGRSTCALLTDMDTPLGWNSGNAVEVRESIDALHGGGPADLRSLTIALGVAGLRASGRQESEAELAAACARTLDDGTAWARFVGMVEAQGGRAADLENEGTLLGEGDVLEHTQLALETGIIHGVDAMGVGRAVIELGGGRGADGSAPHPGVGVILVRRPGDAVQRGEPWAILRSARGSDPTRATALLRDALRLGEAPWVPTPVVLEAVD